MNIGIASKEGVKAAIELASKVRLWIYEHGFECLLEDHVADHLGIPHTDDVWEKSDLLVAMGGDGTLLRSIRMSVGRDVPVLGVHMGYLGFLTEVTEEHVYSALSAAIKGECIRDERSMLEVTLRRGENVVTRANVLNDAVITKGALARIFDIEVWSNSTFITRYRADGLIVSTPTGSTAYNLAADGPIVHPDVPAVILTPICPHVLSNRSIVLPDTQEATIVINSTKASDNIFLTLDGQKGHPVHAGDTLTVKRGKDKAVMLRIPPRDYFKVLRTKLKWQER